MPDPVLIKFKGPLVDSGGKPLASRRIRITPSFSQSASVASTHQLISDEAITVFTDQNGDFEQLLYATDDDSITPVGFTYRVEDDLGRIYNMIVPKDTPDGILYWSDSVSVGPPSPGVVQIIGGLSEEDLDEHIQDSTPHPAYDDMPSLVLLFENGLV